jgi:hypothetical protein
MYFSPQRWMIETNGFLWYQLGSLLKWILRICAFYVLGGYYTLRRYTYGDGNQFSGRKKSQCPV